VEWDAKRNLIAVFITTVTVRDHLIHLVNIDSTPAGQTTLKRYQPTLGC